MNGAWIIAVGQAFLTDYVLHAVLMGALIAALRSSPHQASSQSLRFILLKNTLIACGVCIVWFLPTLLSSHGADLYEQETYVPVCVLSVLTTTLLCGIDITFHRT